MKSTAMKSTTAQGGRAAEVRASAGRLSRAAPLIERIEIIDERLSVIAVEVKDAFRGGLPHEELGQRFASWLQDRQLKFGEISRGRAGALLLTSCLSAGKAPTTLFHGLAPELAVLDILLVLFTPEELESRARAAISRIRYEPGLPSSERAALRERLTVERAALVEERERLVDECCAAGFSLEHLAETAQRREQDTATAQAEAKQRQRQDEVLALADAREAATL